jgi:hypothetical protein
MPNQISIEKKKALGDSTYSTGYREGNADLVKFLLKQPRIDPDMPNGIRFHPLQLFRQTLLSYTTINSYIESRIDGAETPLLYAAAYY